jgi:hypothetical protein
LSSRLRGARAVPRSEAVEQFVEKRRTEAVQHQHGRLVALQLVEARGHQRRRRYPSDGPEKAGSEYPSVGRKQAVDNAVVECVRDWSVDARIGLPHLPAVAVSCL